MDLSAGTLYPIGITAKQGAPTRTPPRFTLMISESSWLGSLRIE